MVVNSRYLPSFDKDLWVKIFPRVNIQTSQTIVTEYKTKDKTQFYSETNPQHFLFLVMSRVTQVLEYRIILILRYITAVFFIKKFIAVVARLESTKEFLTMFPVLAMFRARTNATHDGGFWITLLEIYF